MARRRISDDRTLVRRAWTRAERGVVIGGLCGRLLIAIEPVICAVVFGALTAGLIFFPPPAADVRHKHDLAIVIAPIFGVATLAFVAYAIAVVVKPIRALAHTFSPIYKIDGYIRYRRPDRGSDGDSNGYVAVLCEQRRTIAEWPTIGTIPMPDSIRPAMIEFSTFGGIHRVDGRSTGIVPESLPALGGIGLNLPRL